jgi:oxygen-independent coproporphyrinogen-3 oxidase
MNHIYIHIPFCLKKCAYCNFYSITDSSLLDSFINSLLKEIEYYAEFYGSHKIKTIYLGGGTPSILSPEQISKIYKHLNTYFEIDYSCEFTIEANPETIDITKLAEFRNEGINRISIGVQSFNDSYLKYLGRIHSSKTAARAIKEATKIFDNVSIDLIYGIPGQSLANISEDLQKAIDFSPQHISCYELTFEEETPLYKDKSRRDNDEGSAYNAVKNQLKSSGYLQYEISNYSLPGFECRHNLAYWSDRSYLGLGPSANSYDREQMTRWANRASIQDYISDNNIEFTEDAQEIDKLIMGLRKTNGMKLQSIPKQYQKKVDQLIKNDLLKFTNGNVAYTNKGVLISNRILMELI